MWKVKHARIWNKRKHWTISSTWLTSFKCCIRACIRLGHTSSRRFQDVFKTSCKNVFKTSSRRLQNIFKTSSRRFQDVLKISWRRFCKTSWRRKKPERFQDAFKTYHQIILFLLTSFQDVFKTYSQRFWGVLQRRLSTEGFA